ncbi:MAG: choice-of-anchor Q domain-containing protein, partial [Chloroflexota bacterium]
RADDEGGGAYISSSDASIVDSIFNNNFSKNIGGALFIEEADVSLIDVTVTHNIATNNGGGIYKVDYELGISGTQVLSNTAGNDGGGIYNENDGMVISDSVIEGNTADNNGGGVYNYDTIEVNNSVLERNSAGNNGGGFYNDWNATLTDVEFSTNSATNDGGGIFNYYTLDATNLTIKGNEALRNGGGLLNLGYPNAAPTIDNGLISGNKAAGLGGGIFITDTTTLTLTNLTVSGNSAAEGGGIYNHDSSLSMANSIVWGNAAEPFFSTAVSTAAIQYSIVEGSGGSSSWDSAIGVDGGNNLDSDPLFTTSIDANNAPSTGGDFNLQQGSPALDSGNSLLYTNPITTDISGNDRIQNGTIDMGAYEAGIFDLDITFDGLGSGTIAGTSDDCTDDCSDTFIVGTVVTLTATPDANYVFDGWTGDCSSFGTNPCVITISADTNVGATFSLMQYTLTLSKTGDGSGTIMSEPGGINCGAICTYSFDYGTVVTLTATADSESQFAGWSNGCTGSGQCIMTIEADSSIVATFGPGSYVTFLPIVAQKPVGVIELVEGAIPAKPVTIIGEIFYTATVEFPASLDSGTVYLSSDQSELSPIIVDNVIQLIVGTTIVFEHDFTKTGVTTAEVIELPQSVVDQLLGESVTVVLKDKYGGGVGSSPIYLVTR